MGSNLNQIENPAENLAKCVVNLNKNQCQVTSVSSCQTGLCSTAEKKQCFLNVFQKCLTDSKVIRFQNPKSIQELCVVQRFISQCSVTE